MSIEKIKEHILSSITVVWGELFLSEFRNKKATKIKEPYLLYLIPSFMGLLFITLCISQYVH